MSKTLKKNSLIIAAFLIGIMVNFSGVLTPSSEVAELSTASVLTPEFKETVRKHTIERCAFQDEIDSQFLGLDSNSANYKVLYEVLGEKYEDEKYKKCEIPKLKIDKMGLLNIDLEPIEQVPVVNTIRSTSSQSFPEIESTYYERAYGYVPEIPTPVLEFEKP